MATVFRMQNLFSLRLLAAEMYESTPSRKHAGGDWTPRSDKTNLLILAARYARVVHESFAQKGRGECRVLNAPAVSRAKWVVSTRGSHRGFTGSPGIPARNGFNGFLRALLGDRACCHRRLRDETQT